VLDVMLKNLGFDPKEIMKMAEEFRLASRQMVTTLENVEQRLKAIEDKITNLKGTENG